MVSCLRDLAMVECHSPLYYLYCTCMHTTRVEHL
uniref:Uncharacterized protein n=1 Tax=Arundo donax TaxID=35708 RepID=A0A0A9H4W9_ARUDO